MFFKVVSKLPLIFVFIVSVYFGILVKNYTNLIPDSPETQDPYAFVLSDTEELVRNKHEIFVDNHLLFVEYARSQDERELGLMYREELAAGTGMLFFFPIEGKHSFWMKNTKIPLDIIWFNDKFDAVHIEENVLPCRTLVCKSYAPKRKAKYVLEVNAGWAKDMGVETGSKLKLKP